MAISESSARSIASNYVQSLGYYRPRGTDVISIEHSGGFWVIQIRVSEILIYKTAQILIDANTGEVRSFKIL